VHITLVSFGKLKTPGLREAADNYIRMARTWCEIEEVELKPLKVPDKSSTTRLLIQEKEGERLLTFLHSRSYLRSTFILDELGKSRTTTGWAALLEQLKNESHAQKICFCIGSSLGFSQTVRDQVRGIVSLGPQTSSHELAKVVLLEQLYRAQSVLHKHPYPNEGA